MRKVCADSFRATKRLEIVYGTDAVASAHCQNAGDVVCMVRNKVESAANTSTLATSMSAESMRRVRTIDRVASGYHAYLVALDGDPHTYPEFLMRVSFVMKVGVVYRQRPSFPGPSRVCP